MYRFILFRGDRWYPSGGWRDFGSSSDDPTELLQTVLNEKSDWWHIVDLETGNMYVDAKDVTRLIETLRND